MMEECQILAKENHLKIIKFCKQTLKIMKKERYFIKQCIKVSFFCLASYTINKQFIIQCDFAGLDIFPGK